MWDLLILTAKNESQKRDFEILLGEVNTSLYCKHTLVIGDDPPGVRIGSGGATLNVLNSLGDRLVGKKVLLIHSGGLSQRMPHLSVFGKIFATLPNGNTFLDMKLQTYSIFKIIFCICLSTLLPAGLLVCASDVIEDVSSFTRCDSAANMILFATELSKEIAKNHGVFVMDDGKLKCILQKPSLNLMDTVKAVLPNGNVLSDCFFWISWPLCERLRMLRRLRGPCIVETCCYGDFMRPIGCNPLLDYLDEGDSELRSWRRAFADIFGRISPEIVNLGPNSFFHMGTAKEFQEHNQRDSPFARKFLRPFFGSIYCTLNNCSIGSHSFLEYCNLSNGTIGDKCILSGCETSKQFTLGNQSILFTICLKKNERLYTTILLHLDDEVKIKKSKLYWMGKETQFTDVSLWEAKLFPIENSREASLHATIKTAREGKTMSERISIAEAVDMCDVLEMVAFRRRLKIEHFANNVKKMEM